MKRAIKKNVKQVQTKHEIEPVHKTDEVVLFQSKDGAVSLPVSVDGKTVWLTQSQMAQLFGKDRTVIARHIRNAISEGEIGGWGRGMGTDPTKAITEREYGG